MNENLFMSNGSRFRKEPKTGSREDLIYNEPSQELKEMTENQYQTILPYAALGERVRKLHMPVAPECVQGKVEDLAEAFELAGKKVHDRNSERSHFANIMTCDYEVHRSLPPDLDLETRLLMYEFAEALADGYEVLELNNLPDDKPGLRQFNPPPELR